jgi:tetratricopeptide (TPR) repeat protein
MPDIQLTNLHAASLYELSLVHFKEDHLNDALQCVEDGLKVFISNGDRKSTLYALLLCKTILLEKLERNGEALLTLEKLWSHIHEIQTEIVINMYEMRARLYNKQDMYEKAIQFAETGIDIARREGNADRCFELWTTLGSIYKNAGELSLSKICFQTASHLEAKNQKKHLSTYNLRELGLLYLDEGNTEAAKESLTKAVATSKKANDRLNQIESLYALGKCYIQRTEHKEAISCFLEAYILAKQHFYRVQERDVVFKLAQCYKYISDIVNHQKYSALYFEINEQLLEEEEKRMSRSQPIYSARPLEADPPIN